MIDLNIKISAEISKLGGQTFRCKVAPQAKFKGLIDKLVSMIGLQKYDNNGDKVQYQLIKTTIALHPNATFAGQGIRDGDQLILTLCPVRAANLLEPLDALGLLTATASIATIAQLVLMIVEMRAKWKRAKTAKDDFRNSQNEIKEIRVQMSDGGWVKLDRQREKPQRVKELFSNPASVSPKPIKVVFVLRNGTKAKLVVSDDHENKKQLDEFIKHLGFRAH